MARLSPRMPPPSLTYKSLIMQLRPYLKASAVLPATLTPWTAPAVHAQAPAAATVNAPPISGELFDLAKATDLTALKPQNAAVTLVKYGAKPAIRAEFA